MQVAKPCGCPAKLFGTLNVHIITLYIGLKNKLGLYLLLTWCKPIYVHN